MIIDEQHKAAFAEYEASLRQLEIAFNLAELPISFECLVDDVNGKVVQISKQNKSSTYCRYICIEGDSPAQAVKDVAEMVRL